MPPSVTREMVHEELNEFAGRIEAFIGLRLDSLQLKGGNIGIISGSPAPRSHEEPHAHDRSRSSKWTSKLGMFRDKSHSSKGGGPMERRHAVRAMRRQGSGDVFDDSDDEDDDDDGDFRAQPSRHFGGRISMIVADDTNLSNSVSWMSRHRKSFKSERERQQDSKLAQAAPISDRNSLRPSLMSQSFSAGGLGNLMRAGEGTRMFGSFTERQDGGPDRSSVHTYMPTPLLEPETTEEVTEVTEDTEVEGADRCAAPRRKLNQLEFRTTSAADKSSAQTMRRLEIGDGEFRDQERPATCLSMVVNDTRFVYCTSIIVVLNLLFLGWQTDYAARYWTERSPRGFDVLDIMFCVFFTVEIVMRIGAEGILNFIRGRNAMMNCFDFILVISQITDNITSFLFSWRAIGASHSTNAINATGSGSQIFTVLRLVRLVRVLRVIRLLRFFAELRTILVSIRESFRSVCWSMLLLLLLTYTISIYITQIVTDHKMHNRRDAEEREQLQEYFGTLARTMLCMYEMVSEGIHYHEVMEPLTTYCSPWLAIVFVLYMGFVVFAVLNVVTGVFVETATQTAAEDRKLELIHTMRRLFTAADADGSGTLSFEEFEDQIGTKEFRTVLKAVDLDADEARDLFHLLDIEESGEIEVDAFVNGCQRLTGAAKAIELSAFMHEWKRWVRHWQKHANYLEMAMEHLVGDEEFDGEEDQAAKTPSPRTTAPTPAAPGQETTPLEDMHGDLEDNAHAII